MNPDTASQVYWRRKINALLHDTPDKATDLLSHEERARQIKAIFQFQRTEWFEKSADHRAAAADRLPFPPPNQLLQPLAEFREFPHPLGGASWPFEPFRTTAEAMETSQATHPFILNSDDAKAAFICIWRFWRNWACARDARFARLPADTRIPDHTIWQHLAVTTAFQGSLPSEEQLKTYSDEDLQPQLILFSIGPVQDFIAAARSTRDLWSGSYLLSYLVSHALGKIARELGPDHVFFPNLVDQPLVDLQLNTIFQKHTFCGQPIWDALELDGEQLPKLLTPSLPNRFMALLPARHPETDQPIAGYARELEAAVREELRRIAESVGEFLTIHPGKEQIYDFDPKTFLTQTKRMLDIQWQTLPIPPTLEELEPELDQDSTAILPPEHDDAPYTPRKATNAIRTVLEHAACAPQHPLKPETAWGLLSALLAFLHDGAKANRRFDAWREGRWVSGKACNKDALNGKEEAVLTVHGGEADVIKFCKKNLGMSQGTLKPGELLGASTLIKRFWHHTFLPEKLGISQLKLRDALAMPNTHGIAKGTPFNDSEDAEDAAERDHQDKYFAVLALDGDEMGKWVSGSKSPPVGNMLSPKARSFYAEHATEFLKAPRAVTPSWHLQFSEALGNFSFHAVQRIVEACNGRLIYAGGDDVLAMLPAREALGCARALRAAFRGEKDYLAAEVKGKIDGEGRKRVSDRKTRLFDLEHEGFLQLHTESGARHGDRKCVLSDPVTFPAIVPGPRSDVSVGIAIAHFKAPLQDVVRAAQAAEKQAKRSVAEGGLGRGAVALTILKRSGEILQWGTRWSIHEEDETGTKQPTNKETAGFRLVSLLIHSLSNGKLRGRFPHKFEALLTPYRSSKAQFDAKGFDTEFAPILERELDHCLLRNEGGRLDPDERQLFIDYWHELQHQEGFEFHRGLDALIRLLRTAAWSVRE